MRYKLFKKQFGAIALIVFLSFSAILIILTFMYNNYLAEEKHDLLQKSCVSVKDFIAFDNKNQENGYDEFAAYYIMNNLATVSECDLFVTDSDGVINICACSVWGQEGSCEHSGTQINTDTIKKIASNERNVLNTIDFYSTPHYIAAVSLEDNTGFVIAADSTEEVGVLMQHIIQLYLIAAIIPLFLMFIAFWFMTYRLTKPLRLMSDAAKAMAKGDFSRRIPVTTDDEIGQLAVSFNQMTNSLARLEEARKSFIANVSHELRTPMTTIGGFIDGILDGTIDSERQPYYLSIVHDEIKRLSRMVEAMLNISKLEANEAVIHKEPFDFKEQVLGIVLSQEQRIEQKSIEILGLETLPNITVNADKDLIYRVVYNLVDNAIKFTDDNGKISFEIKAISNNLHFKIENTGRGIPQKELPYVFERFYKTDKSRSSNKESTGLGLYIVKTIIKNQGGKISVSSIENRFTAFEFTLPMLGD